MLLVRDACKSEEVYKTDDLKSIFNLVTHHSSWEWSTLAYKAFIAIFFIRCLQKANYFGPTQSEGLSLGKECKDIKGTHINCIIFLIH